MFTIRSPMTEIVTDIRYDGTSARDCCHMADEFFTERADQSEVKARIVSNYFVAWARIIAPRTMLSDGKLAYIDLFAGPGRYEDGSASTPLMIVQGNRNPEVARQLGLDL
jgi:hypothetical protein